MSNLQLDKIEKAVISLAKQAGVAYDLTGTGLENDPLGDYDHDGIPNILDSHPKSARQRGRSRPRVAPASFGSSHPTHLPATPTSTSNLTNTLTMLILIQLLNSLKGATPPVSTASSSDYNTLSQDYEELYDDYYDYYKNTKLIPIAGTYNLPAAHPTMTKAAFSTGGQAAYSALKTEYTSLYKAVDSAIGGPGKMPNYLSDPAYI